MAISTGSEIDVGEIKVRIVEVIETKDFAGNRLLQVAYQIVDGKYVSHTAHLWVASERELREQLERVVSDYLRVRDFMRSHMMLKTG